jgi:hypothetical protein
MDGNKNNPVDLEDEINAIRINLYEQTKDMTTQERVDFFNKGAREVIKQYGVKNVKIVDALPSDAPTKQA